MHLKFIHYCTCLPLNNTHNSTFISFGCTRIPSAIITRNFLRKSAPFQHKSGSHTYSIQERQELTASQHTQIIRVSQAYLRIRLSALGTGLSYKEKLPGEKHSRPAPVINQVKFGQRINYWLQTGRHMAPCSHPATLRHFRGKNRADKAGWRLCKRRY